MLAARLATVLGQSTAPSVDFNFLTGQLDSRVAFSRGSGASYFDATGTLQVANNNVPRFDYGPTPGAAPIGLLVEEQRTNGVRNPIMSGAVAGSPGTWPTDWASALLGTGITTAVAGSGVESGIYFVDLQFSGTPSATISNFLQIDFETASGIAASNSQTWTESVYLRLVGGSFANVTGMQLVVRQYDGSSAFLAGLATTGALPTSAPLATQRYTQTVTTNNASTAFIQPGLNIGFTISAPINFTLRIGLPQLELGPFATSPIFPAGTPAATTRALDSVTVPAGSFVNPSQGTIAVEAMASNIASSENLCVAAINGVGGLTTNSIDWQNQSATNKLSLLSTGSGSFTNLGGFTGTLTAGATFKSAVAYSIGAAASYALALNASVATAQAASPPNLSGGSAQITLGFGRNNPLSGYIRRVRYWPRVLSSAELQRVTT